MSNGRHTADDDRDYRQEQVEQWILRNWGEAALSTQERLERLFEEVCELAQACGTPPERLSIICSRVYAKPAGKIDQEVGGIGTTLLAFCGAHGISADGAERDELTRILNLPTDHFRQRHAAKVASGLALDLGLTA